MARYASRNTSAKKGQPRLTRVWIYTLASSNDPDQVRCVVPWRVDQDQIFFGPCKKRIRERLRKQFLNAGISHKTVDGSTARVFVVGVNGGNPQRIRKVVWAGQLLEVMTFADAHSRLRGKRYAKMRSHESSPLHVRPIAGKYRHLPWL